MPQAQTEILRVEILLGDRRGRGSTTSITLWPSANQAQVTEHFTSMPDQIIGVVTIEELMRQLRNLREGT